MTLGKLLSRFANVIGEPLPGSLGEAPVQNRDEFFLLVVR